MNEKIRLVVAVALCAVVIIFYPIVVKKFFPQWAAEPSKPAQTTVVENKPTDKSKTEVSNASISPRETKNEKAVAIKQLSTKEEIINIATPLYEARISTLNGGIKSWKLKNYKETNKSDSKQVEIGLSYGNNAHLSDILTIDGETFQMSFTPDNKNLIIENEQQNLIFRWSSQHSEVEKKLIFNHDTYAFDTILTIKNKKNKPIAIDVSTLIAGVYEVEEKPYYHKGPVRMVGHKVIRQKEDEAQEKGEDSLDWIGSEDKYFLTAILPPKDTKTPWTSLIPEKGNTAVNVVQRAIINPGEKTEINYRAYIGAKEFKTLSAEKRLLDDSIEFGMFSFLAKPTLVVLNFFEKYVKNYGLAIIILTIIIKVVFYPLTKHSLKSMKEMQKMHPQMTALREKYKDNKQKMNQELMELYKRHKINPLGGCLPMLVQIPIFIALYEVLYVAIELRHSPFILWIQDLSEKDPYYVTPVLMGVSMFILQKMTPTAMEPLQEKIMLLMPVVLTVVFINMPSGLVLYWFINNLLQIVQQYHIYKDKSLLPAPKKT